MHIGVGEGQTITVLHNPMALKLSVAWRVLRR